MVLKGSKVKLKGFPKFKMDPLMSPLSIFDPFAELNSSLNEAGYIFKLERFNDSFLQVIFPRIKIQF